MAPLMARPRRLQRRASMSSNSSSSTSPERGADDDNDSFMLQPNDSQSSLGIDASPELSQDDSLRRQYEEICRVSPVHRLPAELLIHIFSRLSAPKDLQSCMLVSKEWARNSVGLLWHRPAMGKWESIHSVVQSIRKANKFFAYQDLVKRLNMSTLANTVSDGTLFGLADCKRIERLTLTNCTKLTDVSLLPLISGNRSLLALDITGLDQVTNQTMMVVADNCLRLQGLNVTGCRKLEDSAIMAIAKSCRHLKRLKFNNCTQLTDSAIMTVAAHSSHLLEIDLYSLQNLESPAVTALLTSCPQLREMRLAHCSRLDDSAFLDLPNDPDMPISFDALRILDLTDCGELGDKGVERIIQTCPRLRNLILAKCRQITDRAVFAITKLGKNLHYIHLGHCARITDTSVEALAKACNRIRYIDLACCSNLTDNSVMKLANLPKLKRIGLVKCAGISNQSIFSLAIGEVKNNKRVNGVSVLERVHLSYCTNLTLEGIHVLLNNCPKLTHLSLTGVQAFLREDLLSFCRDAPPEFNDHQRDVFCVFSGHGVARLRDHLNDAKNYHSGADSNAATLANGSEIGMDDVDDQNIDSESGSNTPLWNVNVTGTHPPGMTPIAPGPNPNAMFHADHHHNQHNNNQNNHWTPQMGNNNNTQPHQAGPHLSQSAPASTGSTLWAGSNNTNQTSIPPPPPAHGPGPGPGHGNAQQVTGMLGATVLDDVDEGDETFGDESELMND